MAEDRIASVLHRFRQAYRDGRRPIVLDYAREYGDLYDDLLPLLILQEYVCKHHSSPRDGVAIFSPPSAEAIWCAYVEELRGLCLDDQKHLLGALILWEVEKELSHGGTPDRKDYLDLYDDTTRFPDVSEEIEVVFEALSHFGADEFVEITRQTRVPMFDDDVHDVDDQRSAATPSDDLYPDKPDDPPYTIGSVVLVQEQWLLKREVGTGGNKSVFEGRQHGTGRRAAIKVLKNPSEHAARRCRYEAGAQSAAEHPYTAPVFAVSEVRPNDVVLIEKFVEGDDWSDWIHKPDFGLDCNLEVLLRVSQAVQQAHEKGFIHRDIKPQNVKVRTRTEDEGGRRIVDQVHLLDWGLALSIRQRDPTDVVALDRDKECLTIAGTGQYMAPEMASGKTKALETTTDVFLLGAVLYEILTGTPPYCNPLTRSESLVNAIAICEKLRRMMAKVKPVLEMNPSASPLLAAICQRAMNLNPASRFPDAGEFESALRRYLRQHGAESQSRQLGQELERLEEDITVRRRSGQTLHAIIESLRTLVSQFALAHRSLFANLYQVTGQTVPDANLSDTADKAVAESYRAALLREFRAQQRLVDIETECELFEPASEHLKVLESWLKDSSDHPPDLVSSIETLRTHLDERRERRFRQHRLNRVVRIALLLSLLMGLAGATLFSVREWSAAIGLRKLNEDLRVAKNSADDATKFALGAQRRAHEEAERANQLKDEAVDKSIRLAIGFGARSVDDKDLTTAQIWFADALRLNAEQGMTSDQERLHRTRLGIVQSQSPRLVNTLISEGPVHRVDVTKDGRRAVITVGVKNVVQVYDCVAGVPVSPRIIPERFARDARFCANGTRVITVAGDGPSFSWLQLWDVASGKQIGESVRVPGFLNSIELSDDEKRFAVGSGVVGIFVQGGETRVFDSETLKLVSPVIKHASWCNHVDLNKDGTLIATAAFDVVRVWKVETGEPVIPGCKTNHPWVFVRFSPDEKLVAAASNFGMARIWNAETGEATTSELFNGFAIKAPTGPSGRQLGQVAFSPNGTMLVAACGESSAKVWRVSDGTPLTNSLAHNDVITCVSFLDDDRVLTASMDGTVRIWKAVGGEPAVAPMKHVDAVFDVQTAAIGTTEVARENGNTVAVEELHSGQSLPVFGAKAILSGTRIFTASRDHTVRIWTLPQRPTQIPDPQHPKALFAFAMDSQGRNVLTRDGTNVVQVWNTAKPEKPLEQTISFGRMPELAAFSKTSRVVIASGPTSASGRAVVFDLLTLSQVGPVIEFSGAIQHVDISQDGKRVALAGGNFKLFGGGGLGRVWAIDEAQWLTPPLDHQLPVQHIEFDPQGGRVVTASQDGTAQVWDASNGTRSYGPFDHHLAVNDACFDASGKWIATASTNDMVRVWDARTGKAVGSLLKHDARVLGVRFAPDGQRVVTWTDEGVARVWKWNPTAKSWATQGVPFRHSRPIVSATFDPTGSMVGTCADDSTARVWDSATGAMVSPPLDHLGSRVDQIVFAGDGQRILTRCIGRVHSWDATSQPGSPEMLIRQAEWTAGQRVNETGRMLAINILRDIEYLNLLIEQTQDTTNNCPWPLLYHRGLCYAAREDWNNALENLSQAAPASRDANVWQKLGEIQFKSKDYPAALDAFSHAIEFGEVHGEARNARGQTYLKLGQFEKAVEDYDAMTQIGFWKTLGMPLIRRGFAKAALGQWEAAAADYDEGIRRGYKGLGDADVPIHDRWHRALIHLALGDEAGYRESCEKMLSRFQDSTDVETNYTVAWTCSLTQNSIGDPQSLPKLAQKAVESDATSRPFLDAMGLALYRTGDFSGAARWLSRSLAIHKQNSQTEVDSSYPSAYANLILAMTHHRTGDATSSRAAFDTAITEIRELEKSSATEPIPWFRKQALDVLTKEARTVLDQNYSDRHR